jgi:hypothetical protein
MLIEAGGIKRAYVFKVPPEVYFVTDASLKFLAYGIKYDEKL